MRTSYKMTPKRRFLSGFVAFHFDSRVDANQAVREVDGRISPIGNVNNPIENLKAIARAVAGDE